MKLSESLHGGWWSTEALEENQFFIFITCTWLISEGNALTLACSPCRSCRILPEGYATMRWDYSYSSGISKGNHGDLCGPLLFDVHTHSRFTASPGKVTQAFDFFPVFRLYMPPFVSCFQTCRLSLTAFLCLNKFFKASDRHPVSCIWVQLNGEL